MYAAVCTLMYVLPARTAASIPGVSGVTNRVKDAMGRVTSTGPDCMMAAPQMCATVSLATLTFMLTNNCGDSNTQ